MTTNVVRLNDSPVARKRGKKESTATVTAREILEKAMVLVNRGEVNNLSIIMNSKTHGVFSIDAGSLVEHRKFDSMLGAETSL